MAAGWEESQLAAPKLLELLPEWAWVCVMVWAWEWVWVPLML
jgi:hypothetical protein